MKVMIVVTHLLGTGHLTRAITLAQAFKSAGHAPFVVSGGVPVERLEGLGIPIAQLPPVRSDGVDFSRLLDGSGDIASEVHLTQRIDVLLNFLDQNQPDVLITELFPFGRRILRQEFQALLSAAKNMPNPPLVCSSIRDILAPPSKPKKVAFADEMVTQFYDAVLVHSDPKITPLDLSWPVTKAIKPKLHYTGFVAPPPAGPHPKRAGTREILVSAGGGDVGDDLFQCAREAAALDPHRTWRLFVGGQDPKRRIETFQHGAPANLIVDRTRSDFRQMLHHAAASVSFCGYNTALDLLQSGCPAILVPFDDGNEVEQGIRAKALAKQPGFTVLPSAVLTPKNLLNAVNTAAQQIGLRKIHTGAYGAAQSVQIVAKLLDGRHAN